MEKRLRLFVYGTLQPQANTQMAAWIRERLIHAEPARTAGFLYAVQATPQRQAGYFPAMRPSKATQYVTGSLCDMLLETGELTVLDRYEGLEYTRKSIRVLTQAGLWQTCQTYIWRLRLPPKSRPIASGDFLHWLLKNRQKAFSSG